MKKLAFLIGLIVGLTGGVVGGHLLTRRPTPTPPVQTVSWTAFKPAFEELRKHHWLPENIADYVFRPTTDMHNINDFSGVFLGNVQGRWSDSPGIAVVLRYGKVVAIIPDYEMRGFPDGIDRFENDRLVAVESGGPMGDLVWFGPGGNRDIQTHFDREGEGRVRQQFSFWDDVAKPTLMITAEGNKIQQVSCLAVAENKWYTFTGSGVSVSQEAPMWPRLASKPSASTKPTSDAIK